MTEQQLAAIMEYVRASIDYALEDRLGRSSDHEYIMKCRAERELHEAFEEPT